MPRDQYLAVLRWLNRVVTQPRDELDRWQRTARFAYDLGKYGARQLRQDRAGQMAAALAFRTLFGIVPVLVVGLVLVKSFSGLDQFTETLREFLNSLGLNAIQISSAESATGAATEISGTDWLINLTTKVKDINLAAIGWIGVIVLVYSALGLMVTIENSFNAICRASGGRPWTWRVPVYWFILVFGPVAIAATVYIDAKFDDFIANVDAWQWLLALVNTVWSFCAAWLFMFLIYKLVPNARVAARHAVVGAAVAALLLEIGKRSLGAYMQNAVSLKQLYGSLGLIPVFMFWVYLMWLIVLFGLEVASILQNLRGRRLEDFHGKESQRVIIEPAVVVTVMEIVAKAFRNGESVSIRRIAASTRLPQTTIQSILDRLCRDHLLNRIDREEYVVSLARPAEEVSVENLMSVGFEMADELTSARQSSLVAGLREAQQSLVANLTLGSLLQKPANERSGQASDAQ